jgi:hypothetical protein
LFFIDHINATKKPVATNKLAITNMKSALIMGFNYTSKIKALFALPYDCPQVRI